MTRASCSRHSGKVKSVQRKRPGQVLAAVRDDAKKLLVGLEDPAVGMPSEDADDVGIDQPPDLGLAFAEIAVQVRICQGNGRLGGEHLQKRHSGGGEGAGPHSVFEVHHADELALLEQRQENYGTDSVPAQILIVRGGGRYRRFLEEDALSRPEHVGEHGRRQVPGRDGGVPQLDSGPIAADCGCCLDTIAVAARKEQEAPVRIRVLEAQTQDRGDQLLEVGLA